MLLVIPTYTPDAMSTDLYAAQQSTTHSSSGSAMQSLDGTDAALDVKALSHTEQPAPGKSKSKSKQASSKASSKKKSTGKPAAKRGTLLAKPSQTIDAAIAAAMPVQKLDELLKEWTAYNLQQAVLQAKAEAATLADAIAGRRRSIAEALLAYADQQGVTIAEARKMFDEALEAERSGKSK